MAEEPKIEYGLAMAKGILNRQGCGSLRFAELIGILRKKIPEGSSVRDEVLYWLNVFESSSIISSDYNEKEVKLYIISDEGSLGTLEEEYQKKLDMSLKEWLDLIGRITES